MSRAAKPAATTSNTKQPAQQGWKDKLYPEDYEHLKTTFETFDEDHSGLIDPEQINKILEELGHNKFNPFIYSLIEGLKTKSKPINFDEFLDLICPKIGDLKTKEGLRTIYSHFDKSEDGVLDFEELKATARQSGDLINDQEILEMLHSIHINNKTQTNEGLNFEEFYGIVSKFYKK